MLSLYEDLEDIKYSDEEYNESDDDAPLPSKNWELFSDVILGSEGHESEGDEELMVAAAIELSRETARLAAQQSSGVGSSSRANVTPQNLQITKKAAAVERRLTKGKGRSNVIEPMTWAGQAQRRYLQEAERRANKLEEDALKRSLG